MRFVSKQTSGSELLASVIVDAHCQMDALFIRTGKFNVGMGVYVINNLYSMSLLSNK